MTDAFAASRGRYLGPLDGEGVFCVGNAAECDHHTIDGAVRIAWGGTPRAEDVPKIRGLALRPTAAQLGKAVLPAYLPGLVNLEALTLPAPLVTALTSATLTTLVVDNAGGLVPAVPLAADAALPALRALMWVSSLTTPTLPRVVDPLPPLGFLRTNVTGDESVLRQVGSLPSLRHLEVVDVKNADLVEHLTAPLTALEIAGTGRDFPVARLAEVPTLEAVRLNTVRAEIDCAVFRDLPGLVELTVLNSKKFTNLEALLDCPRLASVTFVNCGNPFGKDGRALFGSREFAHLDIDYS